MNGIINVYEKYFCDLISFQFDLHKRKQHSCLVCTTIITDNSTYGIYSRESIEKFIINYLEHLKVFGYCLKLAEIFIASIRDNGILSSKVKGYWEIKKHHIHEVIIIEHLNCSKKDNFLQMLSNENENEKEKEKEVEENFDI